MLTIIAGGNVFKGIIKNYDFFGDRSQGSNLVVRFELSSPEHLIECTFPKIPPTLENKIRGVGITNLRNAVIDFTKQDVKLEDVRSKKGGDNSNNTPVNNKPKMSGLVLGGGI